MLQRYVRELFDWRTVKRAPIAADGMRALHAEGTRRGVPARGRHEPRRRLGGGREQGGARPPAGTHHRPATTTRALPAADGAGVEEELQGVRIARGEGDRPRRRRSAARVGARREQHLDAGHEAGRPARRPAPGAARRRRRTAAARRCPGRRPARAAAPRARAAAAPWIACSEQRGERRVAHGRAIDPRSRRGRGGTACRAARALADGADDAAEVVGAGAEGRARGGHDVLLDHDEPMSSPPKWSATWPIFSPCVTHDDWMWAKLSR